MEDEEDEKENLNKEIEYAAEYKDIEEAEV